jgi:Na+/H+ antiporter NhaD/arsenite permease-like protein
LGGEFDTVGLGLGFVLIYIIDLLRRGTTPWWPLAPGGVLILVGLAESSPQFQTWFSRGWPVLLILFGLVLLVRTVREGSNRTA